MSVITAALSSEANVPTAAPRRYLAQLCKHFGHKLPVSFDEQHGSIDFATGRCELDAMPDAGMLRLRVHSSDEDGLAKLEDVVARHLERSPFASSRRSAGCALPERRRPLPSSRRSAEDRCHGARKGEPHGKGRAGG
jgi:hypothetical protein